MGEFRMPSLGADMEAGTLVEWLKRPGDPVKRGDVVAVVETQKGAIEVDIFEDGVIERWLVEPGTTVPVGTPLALIGGGRTAAVPASEALVRAPASAPAAPSAPFQELPVRPPLKPGSRGFGPRASPAARRLAAERGIPLDTLMGSGPNGAILRGDVERAALAVTQRPPAPKRLDLTEMRRAIAAAMARSKREIPHYYLSTTVDLTSALSWLEEVNATRPPAARLLMAALLLKAVAQALGKAPEFNGFFTANGFQPGSGIHIGTAISLRGGGLVAPAIHDADKLSIDDLMAQLRDLVARARSGALRSSELSDPTITVTNLGERSVETVFGVIYPPQVALVGFGMPVERPWVVAGELAARHVLMVTLAADHRASDGHRGALFLAEIGRRLQSPETL
jgi:pyruvate dehydrogenase E2 component (dihydrolipoyllysine-residue acetyltransferase)